MTYRGLTILACVLALIAGRAQAQDPGVRMLFADTALFGAGSVGCSKSTIASGGQTVVLCVPGNQSFFDLPFVSPPATEWTGTKWAYRVHWQKTDAGATVCKFKVQFGVVTALFDAIPSWYIQAESAVADYAKTAVNFRFVGTDGAGVWEDSLVAVNVHAWDTTIKANCASVAACAQKLTMVHVTVEPASTSTGCVVRAVEIATNH